MTGDGVSPARTLSADMMWKLMGSPCCCQLRPADHCRLTGGQLRPAEKATAARSARTSSSEEESRSTDEKERLQWNTLLEQNNCLRVERLPQEETVNFQLIAKETHTPGWVKDAIFLKNKPVSRRSTPLTFLWDFCF